MRLFSCKNISQIATQCLFTDHLNHKTVNKATYRMPQSSTAMGILVEKLSNCCNYFLRLLGFPDLYGKVFLITFKFS